MSIQRPANGVTAAAAIPMTVTSALDRWLHMSCVRSPEREHAAALGTSSG